MLSLVVLHRVVSRFLVGLFLPDVFTGCIALKTGRLVQPIVQGIFLFHVMGKDTSK